MKAVVEKLDINKLVNVATSLNSIKTKEDDLDVGKLKKFPVDLTKLSDIIDNEVVKNTKFDTLRKKANKLEKKSPDATTLIQINQCNADKQSLILDTVVLEFKIATVLDTKSSKFENKILVTSNLVTTIVLHTKISEVEDKTLIMLNILLCKNLLS